MASVKAWVGSGGVGRHEEERIYIKAPFALKEVCAGLPGRRWNKTFQLWHVPATTASAEAFSLAFQEHHVDMDQGLRELLVGARKKIDALKYKGAVELPKLPVRTEAWLHQRRAFHFARQLDSQMLAMDMGTGKSLVSIALCEEFEAERVLILCPVSVVGVWPKQFAAHALDPERWEVAAPHNKMSILNRVEQVARHTLRAERLGKRLAVVVNFESSWREPMATFLRSIEWDEIILDESHRAKAPGGKTSKFITTLRRRSRRRSANTGTPMPHSPLDIYAQYRFLDPGIFGTSVNQFKRKFAIERAINDKVKVIDDWVNMDEFTDKFHSIAFVVSKDEALPDLPEKMPPIERTFELGKKALYAYASLANDFVAGVEGGTIVAHNSLSRIMKFRQITSGFAKLDTGEIKHMDDEREKTLGDILEDLPNGEPVVVFAVFHEDLNAIERVAAARGLRYGELSGRRRDGLADDSTMAGGIDVLGCQLKSGGVGVDFTRSCYAIYYSIGYELGDYMQSEDRLHRPGQTRPVRYIHVVANNAPIDRLMMQSMVARRNVVDAVIGAAQAHELS